MIPGPCIICGDTNYNLSCGGPTICPKCDCGAFDAATVQKQAAAMAAMRGDILLAYAERDAADKVSRTAQLYVRAMQEKLAKAIDLLDDLLGLERGSAEAAFAFIDQYRADTQKDPS